MEKTILDAVLDEGLETLETLLSNGSDPNLTEDSDNITPLHFVAQTGNEKALQMARLLLLAGADRHAKTHPEEQTPIDVATTMNNKEMIALLTDETSQSLH